MSEEMTEYEMLCPHCDKINKIVKVKQKELSYSCEHCGKEVFLPQSAKSKLKEGAKLKEDDVSRDFGTLMFVGRLNSFFGWLMVLGCVIGIIGGLSASGIDKLAALIGVAFIPISLLVVASGQGISCIVATERNGKDTTDILRQILEKMEDKPIKQEEGKENK